jgi:transposase-like protein
MDDMNMNLSGMIQDFADEAKCRAYLESLRWPNGVTCPHCKTTKVYRIVKRDQFVCASCEYQFSVTVDTVFHDTHLPLVTWFLATFLLCEAKKGMSACQIQRSLGIKTYKTAWYLCHRIRAAMAQTDRSKLSGNVEMDETFKRGVIGTWHRISAKHLQAYCDEMCFRFNNRKNPYLFRDTVLKLISSPNLEYKDLTARVEDAA